MRGLYRHIRTGQRYFVEGLPLNPNNLHEKVVVYRQLKESTLRGTEVTLPKSTMWVRSLSDFTQKFERVACPDIDEIKVQLDLLKERL